MNSLKRGCYTLLLLLIVLISSTFTSPSFAVEDKVKLPPTDTKYIIIHGIGCFGGDWLGENRASIAKELNVLPESIYGYEYDEKFLDPARLEKKPLSVKKALLKVYLGYFINLLLPHQRSAINEFSHDISTVVGLQNCKQVYQLERELSPKDSFDVTGLDLLVLTHDTKTREKIFADLKNTINTIQASNHDPHIVVLAWSAGSYVAYETLRKYTQTAIPHKNDITLVMLGSPMEQMASWLERMGSIASIVTYDSTLKSQLQGLYSICGNQDVFCDNGKHKRLAHKQITTPLHSTAITKGVVIENGSLYITPEYPKVVTHLVYNPVACTFNGESYMEAFATELLPRLPQIAHK
jgi:hypothetical protein